jgi:predicted nucleic acid-binding protein
MSLYYFDASALVKHYVLEPGSTWVRALIDRLDPDTRERINTVLIAEVSLVEVAAALAISERTGRIHRRHRDQECDSFLDDADRLYGLLPVLSEDFYVAAELTQQHPLKAYDAVQLAVALRYRQVLARYKLALTFVSGDGQLLAAAAAEGLAVDNPFDHAVPADTPGAQVPSSPKK